MRKIYLVNKDKNEYKKILKYLEPSFESCLYLYADIENAEKEHPDMDVWIQESDGKIELVLMRYYDSFQIYSGQKEIEMGLANEIINQYNPKMVSGSDYLIKIIYAQSSNKYDVKYGNVYEMTPRIKLTDAGNIITAEEGNMYEIVRLIKMDHELGGHYNVDVLAKQMISRIRNGTGRNYIIKEGNIIVAHTATYVETNKFAVVSGTIVHPLYRDKPYYAALSNYIVYKLNQEGKRVYFFVLNPKLIKFHEKVNRKCGSYGKLTPKQEIY